jgi:hypothetical protein
LRAWRRSARSETAAVDVRGFLRSTEPQALAAWLCRHDLAGLAFAAVASTELDLAGRLKPAALGAAAANLAHFATLGGIERRFLGRKHSFVLLKGAALATSAYRDPALRPMTDLDLWVRDEDMPRAGGAVRKPRVPPGGRPASPAACPSGKVPR